MLISTFTSISTPSQRPGGAGQAWPGSAGDLLGSDQSEKISPSGRNGEGDLEDFSF